MFGNHQLLERQLRQRGKSAMATVVSPNFNPEGGNLDATGASTLCKVTVRVEPDGEPPFEARTAAWLVHAPRAGDIVPVLYDPSDHGKLVIDHSDAALSEARRES